MGEFCGFGILINWALLKIESRREERLEASSVGVRGLEVRLNFMLLKKGFGEIAFRRFFILNLF
jgi:hypothetical protein